MCNPSTDVELNKARPTLLSVANGLDKWTNFPSRAAAAKYMLFSAELLLIGPVFVTDSEH